MTAVANITEVGNSITVGNVVASIVAPPFVKAAVGLNSLQREGLPGKGQSAVKKWPRDGSLTSATLAESVAMPIDANGEFTQTSATTTAAKIAVMSGLSLEQDKFGNLDIAKMAEAAAAAHGRYVSNDIISQATGFSQSVICSSIITIDDLFLALFALQNSNCPDQDVLPHFICSPRTGINIKREQYQSGAAAYTHPAMLEILNGMPTDTGYLGTIPGLCQVYQTTGHQTTGGDDRMPFVHPLWALCGIFDNSPELWITKKGAEGFYTEIGSPYFYDVTEYNDLAGVEVRADT